MLYARDLHSSLFVKRVKITEQSRKRQNFSLLKFLVTSYVYKPVKFGRLGSL